MATVRVGGSETKSQRRRKKLRLKTLYVKAYLRKYPNRSTNWIAKQAGVSWLFADKVRTLVEDEDGTVRTTTKDRHDRTFPAYRR